MKANKFVKKYGWEKSKSILINAHHKSTHFYCGWMELVDYFYNHENLGWCQVDIRTRGWDSDRCTYGVHPPVNSMISMRDLKRLVKSHNLVESYGGLEEANRIVCNAYKGSNYEIPKGHEELSLAIQDVESCM